MIVFFIVSYCLFDFFYSLILYHQLYNVISTIDGSNMAWRHDRRSHPLTTLPFGNALHYCRMTSHQCCRFRGHWRFSWCGGLGECLGNDRAWKRGLGWMVSLEWKFLKFGNVGYGGDLKVSVVWFETNQGASRMQWKTFNWNLWIRAKFEAFADPHTSIAFI